MNSKAGSKFYTRGIKALGATAALLTLALFAWNAGAAESADAALDKAIAGAHRSEQNKARDRFRHPKETLQFFGLKPDMTVVEVWPGGGWYTEILAPMLRDRGKFYAAGFALRAKGVPDYRKTIDADYRALLKQHPDIYDKVIFSELQAPEFADIAPPGSVDLILTFRNVHNWVKDENAQAMFNAFYDALKPGGILGVVEHRAEPGTDLNDSIRSGYMTEGYVIQVVESAGFKLQDTAEINANPKDTKNHPKGVWTLPPSLRMGDTDREKYLAIGESDRMTIRFVKPKLNARPNREKPQDKPRDDVTSFQRSSDKSATLPFSGTRESRKPHGEMIARTLDSRWSLSSNVLIGGGNDNSIEGRS